MRFALVFLLFHLMAALAPPAVTLNEVSRDTKTELSNSLVGSWKLVSVETIRPNGETIYPFYGKHPQGLLMYDRSGWMSVQIVSDPKPAAPTSSSREGFLASDPAEKVAAIDGYYAYFGTWETDSNAHTVTHHIRQSLYPGEWGETGVRQVSIEGNRLMLTARTHEMGEEHQRKLVWERVVPSMK